MADIGKPTMGDALSRIDQQYGKRPEKQREIKKSMDKDDFLKIMITQMKNQDPTNPLKPEQFASQLAQFTSVEQLANISKGVQGLNSKSAPEDRMALVSMLGKSVTIDRNRFMHEENKLSEVGFQLPEDASSVKVSVISANGEKLYEKDMGPLKQGAQNFAWNGVNSLGKSTPSGVLQLKIEALNERGGAIKLDAAAPLVVQGVSFEGSEPILYVGDSQKPQKISMNQVIRIDQRGDDLSLEKNTKKDEMANNSSLINTQILNNMNNVERR